MKKKIITSINFLVFSCIAIPYTLAINPAPVTLDFGSWLLLLFLLGLTTLLLGTPLHILYLVIIAIFDKSTDTLLEDNNMSLARQAFDTIGIATAYTMIVYVLGLSDSFFSIMTFYG